LSNFCFLTNLKDQGKIYYQLMPFLSFQTHWRPNTFWGLFIQPFTVRILILQPGIPDNTQAQRPTPQSMCRF
jgi:hypothetical protein